MLASISVIMVRFSFFSHSSSSTWFVLRGSVIDASLLTELLFLFLAGKVSVVWTGGSRSTFLPLFAELLFIMTLIGPSAAFRQHLGSI